jgi:hypothetical protein
MRRALLILAGIAAFTWLQFEFVPGHSYLQSETQVYVPILEKLDTPGLLSRDLVATHPNVTYTIYDEVTLFLHEVFRLDLEQCLLGQQIVFRAAGLWGVFLLAQSAGVGDLSALLMAALVNLGAFLSGPDLAMISREPTPRGFAVGLVLLALGMFARERPLVAGLAGGLAFVYDGRVAGPLWLAVLLMLAFDRSLRQLIRPSLTIFAIFVLLLANLAQLQPGAPDNHGFFERIAPPIARIEQYRTGFVWVSTWAARELWKYLVLGLAGFLAARRIWPALNRQTRWLFMLLPVMGFFSIPVSYLLLERGRWAAIPQLQPSQTLLFVVLFAWIACALAGLDAMTNRQWRAAVPFLAIAVLLPFTSLAQRSAGIRAGTPQLAKWAEQNTWGGSMFLFPDAGRELYPGAFRARSKRAVWVDWETGKQVDYSDSFADEWWRRWQDTMRRQRDAGDLKRLLSLPVDYVVLQRVHALREAKPVFETDAFAVYDAEALRNPFAGPTPALKRED